MVVGLCFYKSSFMRRVLRGDTQHGILIRFLFFKNLFDRFKIDGS